MGLILGVDPGLHGCFSFVENGEVVDVFDIPLLQVMVNKTLKNAIDVQALKRILYAFRRHTLAAYIENVQPMPSSDGGGRSMGATSAFSFGRTVGTLYTAIAFAGIPINTVMPGIWKKALQVPKDKTGARHRASQLMPGSAHHWPLVKHDGRAEASLIGFYGARKQSL